MFIFSDHNINTAYQAFFKEDAYSGGHVCVSLTVDSLTSLLPEANYSLRRFLAAWLEFGVWSHLCASVTQCLGSVFHLKHLLLCQQVNIFFCLVRKHLEHLHAAIMGFFFFLGHLFQRGVQLCGGGTGPGLIGTLYPNGLGTGVGMKQTSQSRALLYSAAYF